jgi:PsbP-like protein
MKTNQKGFSLLIALLMILVISVIGFGGYYVWNENNNKTGEQSKTNQTTVSDTEQVASKDDLAAPEGWKEYVNSKEGFKVYYPSNWFYWDKCQDGSTDLGGVSLGDSKEDNPLCGSDKPSDVRIAKEENTQDRFFDNCKEFEETLKSDNDKGYTNTYKESNCKEVTISGLKGTKIMYVANGNGLASSGTVSVIYNLRLNEKTGYGLSYTGTESNPVGLETPEKIVSTFRISQ